MKTLCDFKIIYLKKLLFSIKVTIVSLSNAAVVGITNELEDELDEELEGEFLTEKVNVTKIEEAVSFFNYFFNF